MSYREIQQQLKQFKLAGLTDVKLNAKKKVLKKELNRCFQLGLSETQLQKRIAYHNKIKQIAQPDSLANLKNKVYSITGLDSLAEIRKIYPQIRESNFDFRSKQAWKESLQILEEVHQETLEFEQFTIEVKAKVEQYKMLTQEMGDASSLPMQELLELKDVVNKYIPTLSLTPQQQLMQSWLQQTLLTNNIQV